VHQLQLVEVDIKQANDVINTSSNSVHTLWKKKLLGWGHGAQPANATSG